MVWIKRVLLPEKDRKTYWLFFALAFLLNLSESVAWFNWIINPFLLGWASVGMKRALEGLVPLEFRYGLWVRVLIGLILFIIISRFV